MTLREYIKSTLRKANCDTDQNVLWMWVRWKQNKWSQFGLLRALWREYVA